MKEFLYLTKECGFYTALYYLFHKIKLKINNLFFSVKRKKANEIRLERVYAALSLLRNERFDFNGKSYLKKSVEIDSPSFIGLRPYSSDEHVYIQVLIKEEYKTVVDSFEQFYRTTPEIIIDCGGNIGLASIFFSKFYPNTNFIIIEPFKENIDVIRMNCETARLKNYSILDGGVWNRNGWLSVNRDFRDKKEWSVSLTEAADMANDIKAYSLLEIIENCSKVIDILKIDIEGGETILFKDCSYAAKFLKNVKCLAIEIHDEFNARENIYQILRDNNFLYYNSNEITVALNTTFLSFK